MWSYLPWRKGQNSFSIIKKKKERLPSWTSPHQSAKGSRCATNIYAEERCINPDCVSRKSAIKYQMSIAFLRAFSTSPEKLSPQKLSLVSS
jgi:hypothetical protein